MSKIYGYCRISRKTQDINRQIRNIKAEYPDATIIEEAYTGTKTEGRDKFNNLVRIAETGDTIVFDSVSRMSRNAEEGTELYFKLYENGINLVFLKEHYIDTEVFASATSEGIGLTGNEIADEYITATNKVLKILAKKQIVKAFEQAEKEVKDLQQRTKEGLVTAKLNGKRVGATKGDTYTVKKSVAVKEMIRKHSKDFNGTLTDIEVMKLAEVAKNTYYKYKRELAQEI